MITKETIEFLLATGRAQNHVIEGDTGDAFFIKPDGSPVSLKQFYAPTRIKQTVGLQSAESFVDYFKRFADDNSLIFANVSDDKATFTAMLDYHEAREKDDADPKGATQNIARYCEHVAVYQTEPTVEWKAWLAANRKPMSQVDFATWLEDHLHLFVKPESEKDAPSGADLLELVKSLHGHQTAQFTSSIRLDNGAHSVTYEESIDVRGTMKSDKISLPPFIFGGFSLFVGTPGYLVRARLKTRIENRRLLVFFETVALEKNVRDCLSLLAEDIATHTERKLLLGDPIAKV